MTGHETTKCEKTQHLNSKRGGSVSFGLSYFRDEMQNFRQVEIHDEKCTYMNLHCHHFVVWEA